jgi:hypothetical protein
MPLAAVALVDEDLPGGGDGAFGSGDSLCRWVLAPNAPSQLVIEDAPNDPRFHGAPLLASNPHFCSYVGMVLVASDGSRRRYGALCALDSRPRTFASEQLRLLRGLAAMCVRELELELVSGVCPSLTSGSIGLIACHCCLAGSNSAFPAASLPVPACHTLLLSPSRPTPDRHALAHLQLRREQQEEAEEMLIRTMDCASGAPRCRSRTGQSV